MDAIESLLRRAEGQGVKISGITPIAVPGRGIGVVAIHDIKEGDAIMTVPIEAIRSLHTIPEDISCQLSPEMTIHGLLAAELALHRNPTADWAGLVPQWTDFEATVPMLWPEELQLLLPAEAKGILAKQLARFKIDWDTFRKGFPNQDRRDYLYAWLLVNTRAFYFDMNNMMPYPWHDRLALLPVADLFNHANTGCVVSLMTEHYIITADRPYRAGEEMCMSYGDHSNDYLMSEYGFLLRDNWQDKLCLNDLILPRLSSAQISELEEKGHLGDFMLQAGSKRHDNIWIALRLLSCVNAQWQSYINGEEDTEGTFKKATDLLLVLLEEYLGSIKDTLNAIRTLQIGKTHQRDMLLQRWEQIEVIARQAVADKMLIK